MSAGFFALMLAVMQLPEVGEGQKWQTDYGTALKAAQDSEKPLLIVLHDPAQTTPVSAENRTARKQVAQLLAKYELCQVDVNSKYGRTVAEAFRASNVPFVAIISKDSKKQLYRHAGSMESGDWVTVLTRYQAGVEPVAYRTESDLNMRSFSSGFSGFSRGRSC